jgi:hypothetical protein
MCTYVRTYVRMYVLDCALDGMLCAHVLPGELGMRGVLCTYACSASLEWPVSLSAWCSGMHLCESGSQPRRRWAQCLPKCTCDIIALHMYVRPDARTYVRSNDESVIGSSFGSGGWRCVAPSQGCPSKHYFSKIHALHIIMSLTYVSPSICVVDLVRSFLHFALPAYYIL